MALSRMRDQIGRVLDTRYRLIAPIGAGASAQVFLADDTRLRRRVAVKVLHAALADDDAFLRRFRAEAQAAASLNHPNVLAVYDWGEDEVPYLVTEYLGGGSLRALLDRGNRLTPSQALVVGLEAARALDVAHRRGFVHRDIKPANLLFGEEGRLRIADFGLARALAEAAWTEPQGAVLGTARYASPEQARGEAVDGRADVYSLALVLIESVTGVVPFAADTTIATLMGRIDRAVEVPDSLGPLARVLERAGRPDPADRPEAGEMAVGLLAAAEAMPRPAPLPLAGATVDLSDTAGPEHDLTMLPPSVKSASALFDQDEPVIAVPDADDAATTPSRRAQKKAAKQHAKADRRAAIAAGTVRRRRWPRVLVVILLVLGLGGGGAYAAVELATPSHAVPRLIGLTEQQVAAVAAKNKWHVTRLEGRKDNTVPGIVIDQNPRLGTSLKEGKSVTITVSLGWTLAAVPTDLANKPLTDAEAELTAAGFVAGPPTHKFDENVKKDSVISLAPGTAAQLPKQSTVTLVVSDGPQPRIVPPIPAGATFDQLAAALKAVQLNAVQTQGFSDTVPVGQVITTSPVPGQPAPRGSNVTVVVSKGPQLIPIPNVVGMTGLDAINALKAAGFVIGSVEGDPTKKVLATDPPAGEMHAKGTPVRIIMRG